ncbi:hypothetical protein K435DRAFT_496769 [Dendrothele bispora CBS 962.96]|uniref:Uncharacterized protein n=1 Tax=Dendrothele bispora (strain CBS 962.96) TaxID=1314807 RepID=A0A4S8KXE7_DENBC|nr:hypothetical protein K435DRAFT_496769 [Dendrothele bispora CBS 962.96]
MTTFVWQLVTLFTDVIELLFLFLLLVCECFTKNNSEHVLMIHPRTYICPCTTFLQDVNIEIATVWSTNYSLHTSFNIY